VGEEYEVSGVQNSTSNILDKWGRGRGRGRVAENIGVGCMKKLKLAS